MPKYGKYSVKLVRDNLDEPVATPILSEKSFFKDTFVIEIERKQHDIDHSQHDRPPHELVEKGEAGEQEQKQPAGKQDRVQRIVTEYFRYFVANGRNIGHISDFFWVAGTSGNGGQI